MENAERDEHQNDELNEQAENITPDAGVNAEKKEEIAEVPTPPETKEASTEPDITPEDPAPETPYDENAIPEEVDELPGVEEIEAEIIEMDGEPVKEEAEAAEEEKEQINFELLSLPDLVKVFEDTLNNTPFENLRGEVEHIQEVFEKRQESEMAEKKERFLAEGGIEEDFKPADDPLQAKMQVLAEKYKSLKADYSKQLEATKDTNLAAKQEILEELRILMEGQEGFDNTFRKFKQLQTRWFDVGIVPKQNVRDLWNSYNFFVEKFNDFVKINRELRALDFQKNLDQKEKLCERAEQLAEEKNVANSFKVLQKLHAQWREVGPVPREQKDTIWDRFKAATSVVNKKHQAYQSELKDSLVVNLELKKGLCEKVENIAAMDFGGHREWADKTREILDVQKEWKSIGYAPKKDNNLIYARFRKACDAFFERKAGFYSENFEQQKENMNLKKAIIEQADALKENTDWKQTTEKLIGLQKKWKEVGPVPRKDSDRLWKQFRSACDYFFQQKSDHFEGKNEDYDANLKGKEALVEEISKYTPAETITQVTKDIQSFQDRFNEIGFVPAEVKDKIRDQFKDAVNAVIDKLDVDEDKKSLLRFRLRILSLTSNPKAENKLRFEREKLMTKLQQLRSEIGVWENNIGFFKQTKSSVDTISEFQVKIDEAKVRIVMLEKKIKIIDDIDDNL